MTKIRTVETAPHPLTQTAPLPAADRFQCLPECGLCCSYRVMAPPADQQRLAAVSAPEVWHEQTVDRESVLRREAGFCALLDARRRCTVYAHRPAHCRAYPFLWTRYHHAERDVDFSCPGLGLGDSVPPTSPPEEPDEQRAYRAAALQQLVELLRVQQRYATPAMAQQAGSAAITTLATAWETAEPAGALVFTLAAPSLLMANIETEEVLNETQQQLRCVPHPLAEWAAPPAFLEKHFARSHRSTHLCDADGPNVQHYRFSLTPDHDALQFEAANGIKQTLPLTAAAHYAWQPDALATRQAYLRHWLERQLPLRLANNVALAQLWQGGHVLRSYFEFLLEIDARLAVLTPLLAHRYQRPAINRDIALEAIRGSDGLLRAWCESARVGVST